MKKLFVMLLTLCTVLSCLPPVAAAVNVAQTIEIASFVTSAFLRFFRPPLLPGEPCPFAPYPSLLPSSFVTG